MRRLRGGDHRRRRHFVVCRLCCSDSTLGVRVRAGDFDAEARMRGPGADPSGVAARAEPDFEARAVGRCAGSCGDGILTCRRTRVPTFTRPQLAYGRAGGRLGGGGAGGVDNGGGRHHRRTQQDDPGRRARRPLVDPSRGCKQRSADTAHGSWARGGCRVQRHRRRKRAEMAGQSRQTSVARVRSRPCPPVPTEPGVRPRAGVPPCIGLGRHAEAGTACR